VLINAGNSPSGVEFSARNVDINFASLDTLERMAQYTKNLRHKAREEYDRDISTMTYGLVVVRDTEQEAKQGFQSAIDHGDWDAAGTVMKVVGMESQSFNEQIKQFRSASSPAGPAIRWSASPSRSSRSWDGSTRPAWRA
jgi:dimethylsulfone monooxygenase